MGAPEQFDLPMKPAMQKVDPALVARLPTMTAAIMMCQQIAGLDDKELCRALGIDAAKWSRIKTGQAHFPQERLQKLMDVCGNEVPLIWLALRRGYELKEVEDEWKRQARVEREAKERLQQENALLKSLLVGRAG